MSGWKEIGLNFGLVIGLSQTVRLLDAENPSVLWGIRLVYATTTAIFYGILYICYQKIQQKTEMQELSYTENPSMMSEELPTTIITTYYEYDLEELKKFARNSIFSVALSVFFHFKFGYLQPIFIQSVMPLKNISSNPIVKIHFLNKPAEGELRRPFKASTNPFSGSKVAEAKKKPGKARITKKKL